MVEGSPTTADGVRRHDDVLVPVGSETVSASRYEAVDEPDPVPTLFTYFPYRKDDYWFGAFDPLIHYLVQQGYDVVVADIVGTGASSGRKPEPYSQDEGPQAAEIVEWIADQPWSNGRVGMIGLSYGGETSLKAAVEAPEPLEAIVPVHAAYTGYRDHHQGGAPDLLKSGARWGAAMQTLAAMPPTRRDSEGRWADVWADHLAGLREETPWLFQLLDNDTLADYWRGKDIPVEEIDVPTYVVSGWRDLFTATSPEYFEQLNGPRRLLLGPWRHVMPHAGRETAVDFRRQVGDWFDHFLKGEENGVLDGPTVTYWTEREGGGRPGAGQWRGANEWPDGRERTNTQSFALTSTGLVESGDYDGEPVSRDYEYDHTVGVDSAENWVLMDCAPPDTSQDDARSLTFETEPLSSPVELTGDGTASIRLSATTTDPRVVVRVVDVDPDGGARLVTHGVVRASHRDGHADPEELVPGQEYRIDVPLRPKSHVFEAGHRIRVAVSAAFFPMVFPPTEHGSFTIESSPSDPSTVEFPGRIRPPGFEFDDTVEVAGPLSSPPVEYDAVIEQSERWDVTRHHASDRVTFRNEVTKSRDLPHGRLSYDHDITAEIAADDPTTMAIANTESMVVETATDEFEVVTETRVSHDFAQLTTRVSVDGVPAFEETWTR